MKTGNLIIGWLYPELMSTYGDRGNILVLKKRCQWRGIKVKIIKLDTGFDKKQLSMCNLLFMGGAQDKQQQIVVSDLMEKRTELKRMIENGIPGLYICGAYQFLGKYYKDADGTTIASLGIFDLFTVNPGRGFSRQIGASAVQLPNKQIIVGFENHGGRTYLGKTVKPFGKILKGFGNNGADQTEGAVYKNSFGTYFHGPVLPKNPGFADLLIKLALEKKYDSPINLSPLDDSLELQAHTAIINTLKI